MKVMKANKAMALNLNQTNSRTVYHVNLTDTEQVYFTLTKTFSHANPEQVLSVLQKAEIQVTKENQRGEVNFRFIGKDTDNKPHTIGFVNYYENDLEDDSSDKERKRVIQELSDALAKITVENIVAPLDQHSADSVIDSL